MARNYCFVFLILFFSLGPIDGLAQKEGENSNLFNKSTFAKKVLLDSIGNERNIHLSDIFKQKGKREIYRFSANGSKQDYKDLIKKSQSNYKVSVLKISSDSNHLNSLMGDGATDVKLPIVVYPSPDNVSLTREVKENVDLYTGKLNVGIPIYTIKSRDIEVPISLSYNAGGIKVDEIASFVGLGWNLNAGGAITRVMNNLPDEFWGTVNTGYFPFNGYGYLNLKGSPEFVNLSSFNSYSQERKRQIIDYANWHQEKGFCYEYGGQCSRAYDTKPDEFYFNFGNYSGKFVFDQDGNINLISNQNLKISKTIQNVNGQNKITHFEITTDDGYKYQFGGFENNAVEESELSTLSYITRYQYDFAGEVLGPNGVEYAYYSDPFVKLVVRNGQQIADDFTNPDNVSLQQYHFFPSSWNLKKIISPNGNEVNFNYADNGQIEYMQGRSFGAGVPNFKQMGISGIWYYVTKTQPVIEQYIPAWHYKNNQTFSADFNFIKLKSKRLQSITTLDGTNVQFECNTPRQDLYNDKQLDNIKIKHGTQQILSFGFEYETKETQEAEDAFRLWSVPGYNQDIAFTDNPRDKKRLFLKKITEIGNGTSLPPYEFIYNGTLLPKRTSVQQDGFGFANINTNKNPFSTTVYEDNNGNTQPVSGIPILSWTVVGQPPSHGGNKLFDLAAMKAGVLTQVHFPTGGYKEFDYNVANGASGWNGLKTISIKQKESPAAPDIMTNYTYSNYHGTDGILFRHTILDYMYDARVTFTSNRLNPMSTTKGTAGGYKNVEVSQPSNGKIQTEFYTSADFPNQTTPSYIEWSNTTEQITNPNIYFPFPPSISYDWQRGVLKSEKVLNNVGNTLKQTFYTYDFNPTGLPSVSILNLTPGKLLYTDIFGNITKYYVQNISSYISKWYTLTSKKEQIYDQNGTNYTESTQEYEYRKYTYNNKDYLLPYQQKDLKNSRNEQTVSYTKYPFDYNLTNPSDPNLLAIEFLKYKHIVNAKIEQFSFKQDQSGNNKKYIGGILNKYHLPNPLVKEVFKLKTNGLLSSFVESNSNSGSFTFDPNYNSEVEFPQYDANGRIIMQNKTNDIKETYIWNYNKMYPVAKTVNANQGEVAYSSFEADEANSKVNFIPANVVTDASIAHTGRKYYSLNDPDPLNANITTNIAPIINNTYKLSLWAKGGDVMIWHVVNSVYNFITIPAPIKTRSGWNYYEVTMPSNFSGIAAISKRYPFESVFADEVRLIPSLSQMNTYTFDPLIGMTSETDVNGKTVYYEYDKLNRLTLIKNEDKDIVKRICYNYASLVVLCDQ